MFKVKKSLMLELAQVPVARDCHSVTICTPRKIQQIVRCDVPKLEDAKRLGGEALRRHTNPKAMVVVLQHGNVTQLIPRDAFTGGPDVGRSA